MSNCEQRINEILERVVRMESRMEQLGDHVGANLRTKQRIEVSKCFEIYQVKVDSLDVSLSRILTELRQANMHQSSIGVYAGDALVCTLFPPNHQG